MVARIEARRLLLGLTSQAVIRRCLVRRLDGVEDARKSHIATPRDGSVSTPIDVPPGMSAPEVRARIHLALEDTEPACRPWRELEQAHAGARYEVTTEE
jgi:hypothetical protein